MENINGSPEPRARRMLRLRDIIGPDGVLPVSKSYFWEKVRCGEFPKPLKYGRISFWRAEDIDGLIARIETTCPAGGSAAEPSRKSLQGDVVRTIKGDL